MKSRNYVLFLMIALPSWEAAATALQFPVNKPFSISQHYDESLCFLNSKDRTAAYPGRSSCASAGGQWLHEHDGIDFAGVCGRKAISIGDHGEIRRIGRDADHPFGLHVYVRYVINGDTWYALYAHLDSIEFDLKEETKVDRTDTIGVIGATGVGTSCHLHFSLSQWDENEGLGSNSATRRLTGYMGGSSTYRKQMTDPELVIRTNLQPIRPLQKNAWSWIKVQGTPFNPSQDILIIQNGLAIGVNDAIAGGLVAHPLAWIDQEWKKIDLAGSLSNKVSYVWFYAFNSDTSIATDFKNYSRFKNGDWVRPTTTWSIRSEAGLTSCRFAETGAAAIGQIVGQQLPANHLLWQKVSWNFESIALTNECEPPRNRSVGYSSLQGIQHSQPPIYYPTPIYAPSPPACSLCDQYVNNSVCQERNRELSCIVPVSSSPQIFDQELSNGTTFTFHQKGREEKTGAESKTPSPFRIAATTYACNGTRPLVNVEWENSQNATDYELFLGPEFTSQSTGSGNRASIEIQSSTKHFVFVKAKNRDHVRSNNSSPSRNSANTIYFTLPSGFCGASDQPSSPDNNAALAIPKPLTTAQPNTGIEVNWDSGEGRYALLRSENGGVFTTVVHELDLSNSQSFTDSTVKHGQSYCYALSSLGSAGLSSCALFLVPEIKWIWSHSEEFVRIGMTSSRYSEGHFQIYYKHPRFDSTYQIANTSSYNGSEIVERTNYGLGGEDRCYIVSQFINSIESARSGEYCLPEEEQRIDFESGIETSSDTALTSPDMQKYSDDFGRDDNSIVGAGWTEVVNRGRNTIFIRDEKLHFRKRKIGRNQDAAVFRSLPASEYANINFSLIWRTDEKPTVQIGFMNTGVQGDGVRLIAFRKSNKIEIWDASTRLYSENFQFKQNSPFWFSWQLSKDGTMNGKVVPLNSKSEALEFSLSSSPLQSNLNSNLKILVRGASGAPDFPNYHVIVDDLSVSYK